MASAADNPLEMLAGRRFAFYPAIRSIAHNEWTLEEQTWSEILAKNVATGAELWIPRSHLGEISSADSPVLIVGLKRELALRAGSVVPHRHSVVELPSASAARREPQPEPEPPGPGREASSADARLLALIVRAGLVGVAVAALLAFVGFRGLPNPIAALFRPEISTSDQRYLTLSSSDGYHQVIAKIGRSEREQWITKEQADLQFQALWYPQRSYILVLMGGDRASVRYIGALHDPSRKILDSATLSSGGDASSMMRNLPEF